MKRLLQLALILGYAVLTGSAQVTKSVKFSFTNPNTACSATIAASCSSAITLEDITSLTPVIISSAILTTATSYVYTFGTPGKYTYAAFVTGLDALGNPTQSAQTTVSVTIPTPFSLSPLTVTATLQ